MTNKQTSLFSYFWPFVRPHRYRFWAMIFGASVWAFVTAYRPYTLKQIIDGVATFSGERQGIFRELQGPILWFIGLTICLNFAFRLREYLRYTTIIPIKAEIREKMFLHLQRHAHSFFQDQLAGNLSNKVLDMVRGFENMFLHIDCAFIPTLLQCVFTVTIMFTVHPAFALFTFSWFAVFMIATAWFAKTSVNLSDDQSEANSQLSGRIVDAFRNMSVVKMFAREPYEREFLHTYQTQEVQKSTRLARNLFNIHQVQGIATVVFISVLLLMTLYYWQQEWVSIGDFAFIIGASSELAMMAWWSSDQFLLFFKELGLSRQALSILKVPHDIVDAPNAKELHIGEGSIAFRNVSFQYIPSQKIFRDKNVAIHGGEKVGLVGFSGSGKTTFVNLILRYYDVDKGSIQIDGQDIRTVTQESLRKQISVIPQDTALFHRTLKDNIRYGNLSVTDEEVIEAAKKAHCHDFISQLPQKYDAIVGEGGVKLSGGQRQRIAIARAILKNSPILILDEATSALDSITERHIQESLKGLMEKKTCIVIAHRLSTLAHLDRILVFKDGRIIEMGTHQELLSTNGHYAHLWHRQTDGFLPEQESH
ncbi:MAG: ABC transporter ATP-binding protein [Chlamydiia bacterium]|nr:ABC transporter ATP-binding protein [Chlamydiia bacterium]